MAYNKGLHSSSGGSHRGRPYVLILLIIFGAALLGVMVLHKLRERRIYNLLVKEKDHQLLALQLLLQKERDRTKELRRKNGEMKEKIYALRSQKMELDRTVVEMQSTMDSLKEEQKVMESAFEETQNELRIMQQRGRNVGLGGSEITALGENLKQKEAEIEDSKQHLEIPFKSRPVSTNDTSMFPETVVANRTMAAQDKSGNGNKEKVEHSGDTAKYGGDDKHIINEEASKGKLTMFKDSEDTIGVKDEIPNDEKIGKKNEDPEDDGGAGVTTKDIEAEVVDGREKNATEEEQLKQLKKNTVGGQDFNVKPLEESSKAAAGVKRKHGHLSRTKKNWRTIVKNSLMENDGISGSHNKEVNKGNRKVYKDDKGDLKDRTVGRVSDEETVAGEDVGRHNDKPRKIKPQGKLLRLEKRENRVDAENTIVDNTNHQVTNDGIDINPEKERLSEEQENIQVQQNWSRRHINKVEKSVGQTKSNMFPEEPEELGVSDEQKQKNDEIDVGNDNEDNDDDFSKDSQTDFEDEKDEYKEEIDESEFSSGL